MAHDRLAKERVVRLTPYLLARLQRVGLGRETPVSREGADDSATGDDRHKQREYDDITSAACPRDKHQIGERCRRERKQAGARLGGQYSGTDSQNGSDCEGGVEPS